MLKSVAFVVCLLLVTGPRIFAQTSSAGYVLLPQTVAANQAFNLTLKNPKFTCATRFSNPSVIHNGNVLNLEFKAVQDTSVKCPVSDSLFGPTFAIPALAIGSDSVFAYQQSACAPICLTAIVRQFAGILTVTGPVNGGWFIRPRQTAAKNPFTLQLLNNAYGSCQTSFTHDSLSLQNGSLYASFVIVNNPGDTCATETRPYGPSYPATGLNPGKYPVYAAQQPACEYSNPHCLVLFAPILVDTLTVSGASPILPYRIGIRRYLKPDRLGSVEGYWLNGSKVTPIGY